MKPPYGSYAPSLQPRHPARWLVCLWFVAGTLNVLGQDDSEPERQTVRIAPSKDASLYAEDQIDGQARGNGKGPSFIVGSVQVGVPRRTLIDFDLEGQVPPGAVVVSARLGLNVIFSNAQPFLSIFRIEDNWAPGASVPESPEFGHLAEDGDPTWDFKRYFATEIDRRDAWRRQGGDFNFERPIHSDLGAVESDSNVVMFTSDALVEDVQAMVREPDSHFGWILLGDESGFGASFQLYASVDNEDEALRPFLEVEFTAPSDFDKVVTNYDNLVTIAGRGEREGSENDWRARFEGGPALEAELSRPSMARADAAGNIYFTDTHAHAIRKVNTDGTIETIAGTGKAGFNLESGAALETQLAKPNGLYLLPNGNIYVLDLDNDRIRLLTPAGTLRTIVQDTSDNGINAGRGLWVSADESTIYYANLTRLMKWEVGMEPTDQIVVAEGFQKLGNIDWDDHTGQMLAADIDANVVWRINVEDGTRLRVAGGGSKTTTGHPAKEVRLEEARGISASPHGGFFVTAEETGSIWYVDTNEMAHIVIPGSGDGNIIKGEGEKLSDIIGVGGNKLSRPYSITTAPNGDLIIVTNESGLIRAVRKGRLPVLTNSGLTNEGDFFLEWASQIQRLYLIEASEDGENWKVIREVATNRNTGMFTDGDLSQQAGRLYRVRFYYP